MKNIHGFVMSATNNDIAGCIIVHDILYTKMEMDIFYYFIQFENLHFFK